MINKCCICGKDVITYKEIAFEDLLGSGVKQYNQKIAICEDCGLVFTQNPYTDEQLANRYKRMSKFEYDAEEYILEDKYAKRCYRQKHFLEENIDLSRVGSILEIGAASGYNLSLYKNGRNILGIEPSARNCELAKKNYGVDMFCGMFNEFVEFVEHDSKDKFDLIFLSMVLEHIVNPKQFINDLKKMNNKYMFIEVPTLDIRMDEEPFGMFCEEHVNIFTINSLNNLMVSCGYRLINIENVYGIGTYLPAGYPSMLTIWEKNYDKVKMSYRHYNMFSTEDLLNLYIDKSKKGVEKLNKIIDGIPDKVKLGIWGIGHHASMLLANTSLAQKHIVRVYDSDIRKSGIIFAGCEITVFSEEDIILGEVEALLITTYTAQKASQRHLEKLSLPCKTFYLYDLD